MVSNDGKRTEKVQIAAGGLQLPGAAGKRQFAVSARRQSRERSARRGERRPGSRLRPRPKTERRSSGRSVSSTTSPSLGAALNTDLYELTMAAGFFEAGKAQDRATFELFVRRLPWNRNFVLAAGLAQAVEYLLNLQIHRRGDRVSKDAAAVRAHAFRVLRHARRTAVLGRPLCRARRYAALRGRAVSDRTGALDRSATDRNLSAGHHRISIDHRHQGGARGEGRPGPRRGRVRNPPRAFAGSRRAGCARGLYRRLHGHQQCRDGVPLRRSGIRHRRRTPG